MPADYKWLTNLIEIEQAHGLLVFVRSREDIEEMLQRPLTDQEWEAVQSTMAWRKGDEDEFINSLLNQIMWDAITEAQINTEELA